MVVNKCGGKDLFELGQCQTDMFSVTAPGNNAPPVICGTNSGEHSKYLYYELNLTLWNNFCFAINLNPPFQTLLHKILVYVDSSDLCNDLGFNIGAGTSTVTRSWTIKVSGFW